jgi:hypothetical protein
MKTIFLTTVSWFALVGTAQAQAQQSDAEPAHPLKLTLGYYQYEHDQGKDVNLRWQHGDSHVWIGHYEDHGFGSQDRIGVDTGIDLNDTVSLQPSIQVATGDYVGGSLNAQIGHKLYGLVGWGRTNRKPYFNLNFDPNDAVTLGGGYQFDNGQNWALFVIHDDRLHTGQTDWHLTARIPMDADRLSLDLMRKSGDSEVGYIKAWGLSATWDFPSWFLRLARDPKQNFSADDAWRVSGGMRF